MRKAVSIPLVLMVLAGGSARADVVTDWNLITVQTINALTPASHLRPGPTSILDLATVHVAMHDAIQAFEHRYESYAPPIPAATGSPIAAAAKAAHDVLVARTLDQGPAFATALDSLSERELALLVDEYAEQEALYREAMSIADEQGAELWKLRTAVSHARLLGEQGRRTEARALLTPVYGWFTEGFGIPDLQNAKRLLDELR